MSSSGISFGGLASGLDTQAIISALLAVEQRPIFALEDKKDLLKSQRSLFGDLESKIDELVDAAKDIRQSSNFLDFTASVDREDYFTATADSSASQGSYSIQVNEVATARVASSTGYATATTAVGTGAMLVDIGGEITSIEVADNDGDGTSGTLQDFAAAINDSDAGIRAQVLDTGIGANSFELVVTAEEPGLENSFSLSVDLGDPGFTNFVAALEADTTVDARNAELIIDGVSVQRSSNQITDLIQGVTINLVSADSDANPADTADTTQLTINTDTEATSAKVQEFVDKYNSIIDFIEGQSKVDEEGNAQGALFGDSTLRSVRSTLRNIVSSVVDTGNQSYQMFAQIGLDTETNGRLEFTRADFEAALVDDESAIRNLFADSDNGIANKIYNDLDLFTDSIDGMFKTRLDGIDRRTKTIDDSIRRAEERLEQYELSLNNRFANLEVLMNRLQGQGSAVGGIGAAGFGG